MGGNTTLKYARYARLSLVCALVALLTALTALLGWVIGMPQLASFGGDRIPMAPSTAIFFALLGISIILKTFAARRTAAFWAGMGINAAGALAAAMLLVLSSAGIHPALERMGFGAANTPEGIPLGHMSPATAACFLLACLSYLLLPREVTDRHRRTLAAFWFAAALTAASLVFLLAYAYGSPLLYGGSFIPPAASTCLAFVALGTALMALSRPGGMADGDAEPARARYAGVKLVTVFILLSAGIIAMGRASLLAHESHYRAEIERHLAGVAALKADELAHWRYERLGDSRVLHENANFASLVRRCLESTPDPEASKLLRAWLEQVQSAYEYDRVCLYDAQGVERVSIPAAPEQGAALSPGQAIDALRPGQVAIRDFYRDESDGRVYLALFVPILDPAGAGGVQGLVMLRIDPGRYLYPLINRWPTPSESAETLLVRREGNDTLFLNELRMQKGTALTLRFPMSLERIPAVQAVSSREGILEGIDYRSAPVIACLRKVPESPWYLVAKIDAAEVDGPLRERLWVNVALVSVLILAAGAGMALIWRQQRVRQYKERYEMAEALRAAQARYHHLLDDMQEGFQIVGFDWRYVYLNDVAVRSARQPRELLLGRTMMECYPGIEATAMFATLRRCMEARVADSVENEFAYPDGSSEWYTLSIQPVEEGLSILSLNITERKRAEGRVLELNRIHAMLSEINQTIVRVREPQALFEKACRIAVEEGGFPLAWIGLLDEAKGAIGIAASFGDASGYLEKAGAMLRSGATDPCPIGTALHVQQHVVCSLTAQEATLAECQIHAYEHGFQSIASFPLVVSGAYRGAFTLYASTPDFFDEEELGLLDEMAMDISLAMELAEKEVKRKQAEELLSQVETRRRILFEQSMDAIVVLDREGRVFEANQRFAEMLGYGIEEVQALHVWDWDAQWTREELLERLHVTTNAIFETQHRRKDGAILDVEISAASADWRGQPLSFCIQRDITWRKRAEARMREEEARYLLQRDSMIALTARSDTTRDDLQATLQRITEANARTLDVARVSVWRYNRDRTAIHCLDLYEAKTGGHSSGLVLNAETYPVYFKTLSQSDLISVEDALDDPRTREFSATYLRPLGITSILDTAIRLGGALEGVLCHEHTGAHRRWTQDEETYALATANMVSLAMEASERKRAEESLHVRSAAIDAAVNAVVITDTTGRIEWANSAFSTLTGYSLDEVIGRNPNKLIKSDAHDDAYYENMWTTILDGRVWRGEVINRKKDGTLYTEEMSITPVRDDAGAIVRFVAIKQDITERKRAEETLREAEERLRRAVSAGSVGLWDWNLRTHAMHYSAECKRQLGYAEEEIGDAFSEWVDRLHPDDRESALHNVNRSLANPQIPYGQEFRLQHKDGSYRWILVQGTLMLDEEGKPARMLGTNIDITERKRLEEQFLQAQKMEGIGRLAGGVAHDFNNLLSVINGYADFALESIPKGKPLHEDIQQIRFAGDKAAGLTRQLLAFSRRQVLQPEIVHLPWLLADIEKMLRRLIGEDIELDVVCPEDVGQIRADPGQIEQVLINLAVNARDAMPTGGQLTIEASNVELDETYAIQHQAVTPGPYVLLAVRDTGVGMDTAIQAKVFEPFFTTKETGKGTGLGLATVYGIVKQSGGNIWLYSEVGKGTVFKIYLPRVDEVAPERPGAIPKVIGEGNETILLVEDDESLRPMIQRILEGAGYVVISAAGGEEAEALLASGTDDVALILTDIVMPGISGPELYEKLTALKPALRVLYMSGYTDDTIMRRGVLGEGGQFIGKPFTATALTQKVREVLDET
ncbi:MAG: PAS domain S-box protein [Candidatus Hydrogenedentes bacterium]|nr:PAS domain S-box protein [Candidatus Hydrogenedentota bacterium]